MFASTRRSFLPTLVLALSLCGLAAADNTRTPSHRHHAINRLQEPSANATLSRRTDNAKFTYYSTGQGACGGTNQDSDWIVALNADQYDGGSHCYKTIEISYQGKTAKASIVDECPGCPYGGLDMSPGLFSYFASESEGVIYGSWNFS